MEAQERILAELKELIAQCRKILAECRPEGHLWKVRWPTPDEYQHIRTRALNLTRRACGEDSDHYAALVRLAERKDKDVRDSPIRLPDCLGILEAAEADISRGLLFDQKALMQAEAMGDFLEQAGALLDAGYYVPAASLAGAVLEDGLRKLCDRKNITYPSKTKIDALNGALAKAGVYNKLEQKQITALADIRNNADHGQLDKFKRKDVEDMVKWITRFLSDYLK